MRPLPRLVPALVLVLTPLVGSAAVPAGPASAVVADHPSTTGATDGANRSVVGDERVLAISVDGLNPRAIAQLGAAGAPNLTRLLAEGASTTNARSQVEQTVTLPNHTSMLTGRRINARKGGHGVVWNDDRRGTTVQRAAGGPVSSIFTDVHAAGGTSALFASKVKFGIFRRSWRAGIDRYTADEKVPRLVRALRSDLTTADRDFTFLHLSLPDVAGHASGLMSPAYVAAVARTDKLLGTVVATIEADADLREHLTVLLTADHGGIGANHEKRTELQNYRIPFLAWGPGIEPADLYALNPSYADPGTRRPGYGGPQPVRNGMIANLAASLLHLPPVEGSTQDADQTLRVRAGVFRVG